MVFLKKLLVRWLASTLLMITLGQSAMPFEIAYARRNDPSRFVLNLSTLWHRPITQKESRLIFTVLHLFPQSFYKSLNNIVLNMKHHSHQPRGRASSDRIILEAGKMSDPEMLAVFVHELAHVYDLGSLVGSYRAGPSQFKFKGGRYVRADDPSVDFYNIAWDSSTRIRRTLKKERDFPSIYGSTSPFEDFGESFLLYVFHGDEFLRRARRSPVMKARYQHLLRLFKGQRFAFGSQKRYPDNFFDTTKLPYDLRKMMLFAEHKRKTFAREENDRRRRQARKRNRLRRQARLRLRPLSAGS